MSCCFFLPVTLLSSSLRSHSRVVARAVIGPFLAYEIVALLVLHYRLARGSSFSTAARLVNALIETSLPTVSLRWVNQLTTPAVTFGTWPTMLYFIFIVASTLRLDFVPPAFTGIVAAAGYLGVAI
jgi:adenylate cyclase